MTAMGSIIRPEATLEERWEATGGPVLLTGIQALVRLPMLRREMDAALGWKTGGFISGYRGSPLGGFDKELARQQKRLAAHDIVFQPGLNEDLAATAIWGTQQVGLHPGAKVEGVFAIWYGKGPGVDRSGDVLRHANSAGTAPKGGVLALAGDDPSCKSSTITSGCEYAFMDAEIPVLDPADVAEVLEFGLKGIALSRFSGLWVGMKCVADTMDASMTVLVDPARYATRDPAGLAVPEGGLHIRCRMPSPSPAPMASTASCSTRRGRASASPCAARPMPCCARRWRRPASPRPSRASAACASGRSASPGRWTPRPPAPSPTGSRRSSSSRTAARCSNGSCATRCSTPPTARASPASGTRPAGRCCRT
jgi:hypothetical protein